MFELNQLKCFVVVAEELHFGRAAARLNMTQPPLSRQIQVLEHIMGVRLFNRSSRSVQLTPTGLSFLPEAQRLIQAAETAVEFARRVQAGTAGSVKIAFTAATAYGKLPASLITRCREAMPDVVLLLSEMVTRNQIEGILAGLLDIGLVRPPISRPELDSTLVLSEPMLVAVNAAHPLAAAESIALGDLHDEPFVMYAAAQARYFHDMLVSLFWSAKVQPKFVQHLSQIHSMLALVNGGIGSAIVPASATSLHYQHVKMLPLKAPGDAPFHAHAELHAVWRRDNENPVLAPLLKVLKSLSRGDDDSR